MCCDKKNYLIGQTGGDVVMGDTGRVWVQHNGYQLAHVLGVEGAYNVKVQIDKTGEVCNHVSCSL